MTGLNRPEDPGKLDDDIQRIVLVTRPPAGGTTMTRKFERASWTTRGGFVHVVVHDTDELAELWIPFSLVVEIRVLR